MPRFFPRPAGKPQALYDYQLHQVGGASIVAIIDLSDDVSGCSGLLTVTNAASETTDAIMAEFGAVDAIVYRDTDGYWDQFDIGPGGTFSGFSLIRGLVDRRCTKAEAVAAAARSCLKA
jgi:hypothetical protein